MKPLFGAVQLGPMAAPRALWLTALFAGLARTVHAAGPVVLCEPCDAGALGQCKPLPRDCAERVREPGCGCCLTCALREGQACGVYTGRCGAGLRCQHRPGESKPLLALLEGRGVCTRPTDTNPGQDVDASKKPVEETLPTTAIPTVSQGCEVVQDTTTGSGFEEDVQKPELEPKGSLLHNKLSIIEMEQFKQSQAYKVEPVAKELYHNILKDNRDSKREYGPCRREMESVLMSLSISCVINPRVFRIPNCDRKGFYKKKQCRPSKGPNRGHCWCVDKYGQPLPGYEVRVGVWTSMDSLCRATRAKNIDKSTAITRKINEKHRRD